MLLATQHKRMHPALTPASKGVTRFTYPEGMEGWVDLGALIMPLPGIEPTTAKSEVQRPNRCGTKTYLSFYLPFSHAIAYDGGPTHWQDDR